jgi:hypothetical protein|uniref:Uncharacterized protein n=1 Tax=Zea mays TaxID=4577 RepID=C4J991_MAIZE|nr:unknown [Zea mays]
MSVYPARLLLRQQPRDEWHAELWEPVLALDEALDGVLLQRVLVGDVLDTPPLDASGHVGAGPVVFHLGVVAGAEAEVAEPRQPALRVDEPADLRLDVERARVLLPRAAQEGPEPADALLELRVRRDGAVVDDGAAHRPPLLAALRRDDVLLVVHALAHLDEAVLEHHLRVAEDEVDGARDDAVAVVLAARVRVQRVLVPVEPALVERRHVALHPQRHRLVVLGSRRVLHADPAHQEPVPDRLHRGRVLGGDVHHEALVARDHRLGGAVADHHQVRHVPGHGHVLPVLAGLHVHDVRGGALQRHLGQRRVDGPEVAAAVLGHRHVGPEALLAGGDQQQPALGVGHPRGRAAGVLREEPAVEARQAKIGERLGELVHERQDVLRQLLRAVERLAHLARGGRRGVLEPVQARLLVRERGAQPRPEVVHGALEVGHLEAAEPVERRPEVVDGVVQQLSAVVERARRAPVVLELVEQGGLAHGLRDPVGRHLEDGLGQLRGAGGVPGRRLQRLLARLPVVHGLAEGLDGLHRRGHLALLGPPAIAAAFEGNDADGGHHRHDQDGRCADDGAFHRRVRTA